MLLLDFIFSTLLITNIWVFIYNSAINLLNEKFPPEISETFLWIQSEPEPFEIPIFLILSAIFVLLFFFVKKYLKKEIKLPSNIEVVFFLLLLLLFIVNLGNYPLSGEIDPYKLRSNSSIYFTVPFFYLLFFGLIIFLSQYLNKYLLSGLVIALLALLTFDAGFPVTGHDYEYFIGPSYEVAQGKTVYTDILSRYGFLTINLFASLYKLNILDLFYLPTIIWILYISQYFFCFILLLKASDSKRLALLGALSIMTLNYFSLSHLPSVIPQVGPLRWFPMVFLLFLVYKIKKIDSLKLIIPLSFLCFFMIDVGIAMILAYLATLALLVQKKELSIIQVVKAILLLLISLISILLLINLIHIALGLKPVDILTPFYSFRKHAVLGLSLMPIATKTYFWFVPLIYFASLIFSFRTINNQQSTILLFSANLSLFASVYFVGRSHPHNLFNISLFPLLNLFILIGLVTKNLKLSTKKYLILSTLFFILLIVIPTYHRRFTLSEMLIDKYSRFSRGRVFESEVPNIIRTKYKEEIKLIKNNLPEKTIILSSDDTYLFYETGKQNLLDANPILGIDLPEDLNFAVKTAVKSCPEKIAIDCTYLGKCPSYTPFIGVRFDMNLLLNKLETGCKVEYTPTTCTNHICFLQK